jgi:hypothetical protein
MFTEMSVVEILSYLRHEPARRTQIVAEYDACNAPFSPEPWFEEWATPSFDRGAEIFHDEDWVCWTHWDEDEWLEWLDQVNGQCWFDPYESDDDYAAGVPSLLIFSFTTGVIY